MSNEQEQTDQEKTTPKSKIQSRHERDAASTLDQRRATPATILVYIVIIIFTFFYGFLIPGEPSLAFDQRLAITVFFRLMIVFLLINRSVIGWFLAIVFESLQIILVALLIEPPGGIKVWGMLFMHTAALALLLTGLTRQHIWSKREESLVPPPSSEQPDSGDAGESDQAEGSSSSSRSSSST